MHQFQLFADNIEETLMGMIRLITGIKCHWSDADSGSSKDKKNPQKGQI